MGPFTYFFRLSPSQQLPGRYDAAKESDLPDKIPYEVFVRSEYKTQFYTIQQALEMHRLLQNPKMYNRPNALLKIRFELNMTTEKAVIFWI